MLTKGGKWDKRGEGVKEEGSCPSTDYQPVLGRAHGKRQELTTNRAQELPPYNMVIKIPSAAEINVRHWNSCLTQTLVLSKDVYLVSLV